MPSGFYTYVCMWCIVFGFYFRHTCARTHIHTSRILTPRCLCMYVCLYVHTYNTHAGSWHQACLGGKQFVYADAFVRTRRIARYVCIHMCMYVCRQQGTCLYIYILFHFTLTYIHTYIHTYKYIHIYTHKHIHIYSIHESTTLSCYIDPNMHTRALRLHTHICMHTQTHTHIHICRWNCGVCAHPVAPYIAPQDERWEPLPFAPRKGLQVIKLLLSCMWL